MGSARPHHRQPRLGISGSEPYYDWQTPDGQEPLFAQVVCRTQQGDHMGSSTYFTKCRPDHCFIYLPSDPYGQRHVPCPPDSALWALLGAVGHGRRDTAQQLVSAAAARGHRPREEGTPEGPQGPKRASPDSLWADSSIPLPSGRGDGPRGAETTQPRPTAGRGLGPG